MASHSPVETHVFRCLSDNIGVLVRDPATGACAAIDVPEAAAVMKALSDTGWTLTDILVTHKHADHVQGIPEVVAATGARVVAPAKGPAIEGTAQSVAEGDTVRVGDLVAQVWETPGHCEDHVTFHFAGAGLLFPGDVLFPMGCGRVFGGGYDDLWRALSRIAALPDETIAHCGHDYTRANARFALAADPDNAELKARAAKAEEMAAAGTLFGSTTVGEEKATNPFMRAGEPALARSVKMEGRPASEVFRALREWKNNF
ncbi:hydroxyacylglutathione hydrolase [Salinarimonas ramus]|uniref:Hydroxyacylglutathione hydrolase n=1 Tax=Salinarimonas ramus TaxID=690164 RepID=A0A917QK59_9HYPH|nr:hydroxyacylglutathione hydrolase [Salinarimonas ramus]GGK53782.1 hydroxyacylglutathione hydrolase [Salinarimonas ramus]